MPGIYYWGVVVGILFLVAMVVRAYRMPWVCLDCRDGVHGDCSCDCGSHVVVRPVPTVEEQAAAEARVDWDKPVGYSHAERLLGGPRA